MVNHEEIAYCAGLFDGEGCISTSQYFTQDERERYHTSIFLGMQDLATVEFFQRVVGLGSVNRRSDGLWMFQASGAKAANVLRVLAPYLRTKREAALLFVEFAATFSAKNRKPLPSEIMDVRRDLARRIHDVIYANAKMALAHANGGN